MVTYNKIIKPNITISTSQMNHIQEIINPSPITNSYQPLLTTKPPKTINSNFIFKEVSKHTVTSASTIFITLIILYIIWKCRGRCNQQKPRTIERRHSAPAIGRQFEKAFAQLRWPQTV